MRNEWSRIIDLLIMAMSFIKYAPIADSLNVTQCVVAVRPLRASRLLCFIFRTHLAVVDAGQNVHTLATERVLRKGVSLVYDLITTCWKHGGQWAVWVVDLDRNQSRVGPVKLEIPADHFVEFGPGARRCGCCGP